jgi:two-component sensor histidine kinase
MAWQSFRGEQASVGAVENFNARLHALACAHTILSREHWSGAPLADVVRQGLTICTGSENASENAGADGSALGGGPRRLMMSGPDLRVNAAPTVSLVMVLHELATNAIKYGALSGSAGSVSIGWTLRADGAVVLEWREQGGPPVLPPTRSGFGSRLIHDAVTRQLSGQAMLDYAPAGLLVRLELPAQHFGPALPPPSKDYA